MENKIIIIGAGGHARVVADAIIKQGKYTIAGFADDAKPADTGIFGEFKVLAKTGDIETIAQHADFFIAAIGENATRSGLFERLSVKIKPATVIHPAAVVSANSVIGEGSIILANAVISEGVRVGKNCIINALSLIDHDSFIGDHTHISQGTIIGSDCRIKSMHVTKLGECINSGTTIES